ncbi:MAG: 6-bladed beta-propeller [Bryobacteraceae bacterium]
MRLVIAAIAVSASALHAATPARGTVDYLRTLPSVREFTKPKSFFSKLVQWVAGAPDDKPEVLRPYSITHDSTGRLLIADPGAHGVHVFDFEKQKYQFLKGPRGKNLSSPIGIVCDNSDNVYVTDSERAQIYIFDAKGRFQRTIGGNVHEVRFERPTGLAIDTNARRLYITDTLRHQVLVLGLNGELIRTIGKRGAGPGEFNFPTSLTLASGKLHVVDAMNFRIQTLSTEGQFLSAFGQPGNSTGTMNRPKGIAADTDGNIYVVDALFETVQVFDQGGKLLYYFGSNGRKPGQFQLPSGISIDDRNIIYIADSYNQRVQVFRYRRVSE